MINYCLERFFIDSDLFIVVKYLEPFLEINGSVDYRGVQDWFS